MPTITLPAFAPDRPAAQVDAALRQALAACDQARECAVLWFADVQRRRLYRDRGHPSLEVYATQELGFSRNRYWQFKRLADDLERLPVLKEAVAAGDLGWTKAQQVARVATPETQDHWVAAARTTTRRDLTQAVRQLRRRKSGRTAPATELPLPALQPPAPPAPTPVTITLKADALQLARFEALLERARKRGLVPAGSERLETLLAALESFVADDDAATHSGPAVQIVVHQCPDCGETTARTSRGELPLAPAQVGALACDARVGRPGEANRATVPPKVRAAVLARDRHRCATPGCGATRFLEVHHVTPRAQGGANTTQNLVTLCSRCHRFAHEQAHTHAQPVAVAPAQVERASGPSGSAAAVAPAQVERATGPSGSATAVAPAQV